MATDSPSGAAPSKAAVPVCASVALLGGYLLSLWVGDAAPAPAAPGITDAGRVVGWSQALLSPLLIAAQVFVIGALLYVTLLVGRRDREVTGTGARALRHAGHGSAIWFVLAVVTVPVTYAYLFGEPVGDLRPAQLLNFLTDTSPGRGMAVVAASALVIAICARFVRRLDPAAWLLAVALVALVPVALAGHAAGSADHDLATGAIGLHVLGVCLWVGGLVALALFGRGTGPAAQLAVRRYSGLALGCFVAVAVSGVASGLLRVSDWSELVTSGYGRLMVVKAVLLVLLGGAGFLHRRRTIPSIVAGSRAAFIRLAVAELALMALAMAAGVALARSPAPEGGAAHWTVAENTVGYRLPALTPIRWLTAWRPDVFVIGFATLVLAGYLAGAVHLHRRGLRWNPLRTITFALGTLVALYAIVGPPGFYGPAMFSMHMVGHMLLTMLVPVLLGLGAPITLALRALPATAPAGQRPMREWLLVLLQSRVSRLLTHPLVALGLYVVTLYAFYFSPLFGLAMRSHVGHMLMQAHFLAVGCLYFWVVLGVDPIPRKLSHPARLGLLLASTPFHAFFGVVVMDSSTLVAGDWYAPLQVAWTDLAADQRLGGGIAWGFGEGPTLILVVVMALRWFLDDRREARRFDRSEERTGDAQLQAYNDYLAHLRGREGSRPASGPAPMPTSDHARTEPAGARGDTPPDG